MSDGPHVMAIHVAPASRLPMKPLEVIEAEAGRGLVGDRYHSTRHRHVTVQSLESLAEAAEIHGSAITPADTRRNITITGGGEVPSAPGTRMSLGNVEVEVVRIAAPRKLLDDVIGPGAKTALRRKAGSVCRILTSGVIRMGDRVDLDADGNDV